METVEGPDGGLIEFGIPRFPHFRTNHREASDQRFKKDSQGSRHSLLLPFPSKERNHKEKHEKGSWTRCVRKSGCENREVCVSLLRRVLDRHNVASHAVKGIHT